MKIGLGVLFQGERQGVVFSAICIYYYTRVYYS